jgi:hypothetical protein
MKWGVFVTGRQGWARIRAGAWLGARRGAALRVVVERQHALFTIISYVKGEFQGDLAVAKETPFVHVVATRKP